MRAVAGLGNVGPEYAASRHNVGFWVVERLLPLARWRRQMFPWGEVHEGPLGLLLRPHTYMNRSGEAVAELVARYSLLPGEILVVYDDADLSAGEVRLRMRGGPGTHRGMQSVVAALGTPDVPRLRVGIGPPPPGGDWVEHVLRPPRAEERDILARAVDRAGQIAWEFLATGPAGALDRFSREGRRPDRII